MILPPARTSVETPDNPLNIPWNLRESMKERRLIALLVFSPFPPP